jgi:VIT1/CCC1 family predicted Fe2+/Mn2+ transporter
VNAAEGNIMEKLFNTLHDACGPFWGSFLYFFISFIFGVMLGIGLLFFITLFVACLAIVTT